MKSIHSYFKLKGGKLKYHSHTWVRLRFSLSLFFFGGGGGGVSGGVFGGMGACLLPTSNFFKFTL